MTAHTYRPSLALYAVWHPGTPADPQPSEAEQLAHALHARFHGDPKKLLSRGIGIPIFFRGTPSTPSGPPAPIPLDSDPEAAEHTVIVLLIDDAFILDPAWEDYAQELDRKVLALPRGKHLLVPVQLGPNPLNLGVLNSLPLPAQDAAERERWLLTRLTHELCRLLLDQVPARNDAGQVPLSRAPVKLFLSHAKRDGQPLAEKLHHHLSSIGGPGVDTFFDTRDIPPGSDFSTEIEGNIERSAVVAFQTDAYSSRPWCRRELLVAKRHGCPVVVVNAVVSGEERTFPYLGNTPSLRWEPQGPDRSRDVVDLALYEVLRATYTRFHLKSLRQAGWIDADAVPRPRLPEVITCLSEPSAEALPSGASRLVVYPDPPLGQEELELLAQANPRLRFATPTALAIGGAQASGPRPLEGRKLALSISESDDLTRLGLGQEHLDVAWLEFARHLLAAGATLLYGGDLRGGGFTEALMDLVLEHRRSARELEGSILSFLAWPEWKRLPREREAELRPKLRFHKLPPPQELSPQEQDALWNRRQALTRLTEATVEDRHVLAGRFTDMREEMNRQLHARIVLGGRVRGFVGTVPGLVEEAWLAMSEQRPLYVVGGFGGCARAIAEALLGKPSLGLETAAREPAAQELVAHRSALATRGGAPEPEDTRALERFFRERGVAGLRNGLTEEENRRLFETPHVPEMIFLVLKGLASLPTPGPA
jgi:hypothetical protein